MTETPRLSRGCGFAEETPATLVFPPYKADYCHRCELLRCSFPGIPHPNPSGADLGGRQARCAPHEGEGYESGLETIYREWAGISSGICGQNTHLCIFLEREPKAITRFSKGLYVPKCFRTWADRPGDTRGPTLYPEVPGKLWTPPRECWGPPHGLPSSRGSAFSVSSQARPVQMVGRRYSLGRAQSCTLLGSVAERPCGETALCASIRVSAPPAQLASPSVLQPMPRSRFLPRLVATRSQPCRALVSVSSAPSPRSSPGLSLPVSGFLSDASLSLWVSLCASGFPVLFWVYRPVFQVYL